MSNRRDFLLSGSALAAAMAFPFARAADVAPTRSTGGHLIANTVPEPPALAMSPSNPSAVIASNLFDSLVSYGADFKPTAQLATSWSTSDDGKRITFVLRKGVRWHDGQPFTSADVKYSLMEVAKKYHALAGPTFSTVTDVETPDIHTAVFVLSRPSPVIWAFLNGSGLQILPSHLYGNSDPRTNPLNNKPIGTGPFVFKEWVRGSHIALERNKDYWDHTRPLLDRITFRIIPDTGAREAALETGELHYAPLSPVPLSSAKRLRANPDLVVEDRGWEAVAPVYFFDFNLKRKEFQDVRVRRAFAHAIDRQALADVVWYGFAEPSLGPVPSFQKQFFNPDTPQYAYDPAKAEALLDEAGLKRGPDGVRLRINHLNHTYGDDFKRSGDFYQQQLKAVGIELELVNYDLATYLRKVFTERDYDTTAVFYAAFADPQIGVVRRYWSKTIQDGVPWSNGTNYSSAEMDRVIEGIHNEPDAAKRQAYINELQVIAQTDLPSINLLDLKFFRVFSKRLTGVDVGPVGVYAALGDAGLAVKG